MPLTQSRDPKHLALLSTPDLIALGDEVVSRFHYYHLTGYARGRDKEERFLSLINRELCNRDL